jgi:hypothetical protein
MKKPSLGGVALAFLATACGSGGSNPVSPSNNAGNRAPVTPSVTVGPAGRALVGATRVSFTASTSDPDGDALTYNWNFGDGSTGSGASVEHVYNSAGTFNATVTVTDGKGGTATGTGNMTAASIAGSWTDADPFYGLTFTQNGSSCSGAVFARGGFGQVSTVTQCTLSHPRRIHFMRISSQAGFATCEYDGTIEESMNKMVVRCVANSATSFSLTRD